MSRRPYLIDLMVNGKKIREVIVDSHYEEKHSESMNDGIIMNLVKTLDGEEHEPAAIDGNFSYFVKDGIEYRNKLYKLIWLLEKSQKYIGIVNAYRR